MIQVLVPSFSYIVEASAGSGKTWLLVSRMIRLLLAGAAPSELLAVTFTHKAAIEMQSRLDAWLADLALLPESEAIQFLVQRGLNEPEARAALPYARNLSEMVNASQPGPMITTFHGWFFHLLSRAPLPLRLPGEVIEDAALLREEAWHAFADQLGLGRGDAVEANFSELACELSLASLRQLMDGLMDRRAEWWAAGLGQVDPTESVCDNLETLLGVREGEDVIASLFESPGFATDCREYLALVARNGTEGLKSDIERAITLERAMAGAGSVTPANPQEKRQTFDHFRSAFLTQKNILLARKPGKELDKRLGVEAAARYMELHRHLGEQIQLTFHRLAEQRALWLNRLGLQLGQAYLDTYQRLKQERGGLDFSDGELEAAKLLADEDAAAAIQMKLDTRWKHVLLDEFQDANPLQWRILRGWLEAYGADAQRPTVFMVGDPKQSIYRFRRAEPRLFEAAANWLEHHFAARRYPQNETRRCAPRVVAWVNALFSGRPDYLGFVPHTAHQTHLPGWSECHAAVAAEHDASAPPFRNPLETPAPSPVHRRLGEAAWVAARIQDVVGGLTLAEDGGRPARYADILVLYAKRTDLAVFETAFRQAGIPHVSDRRGGLLDTLEASDLTALLTILVSPLDDLNLAHALKSPVFACSDTDLRRLARGEGAWWDRLMRWARAADAPAHIRRAARQLSAWRERVGTLPVHDLLDRIFHEGDIPASYSQALPEPSRATALANLDGILGLSLALSGGRYPSLPRFLDELRQLRDKAGLDGPDEPPAANGDVVRMLTIHGAKGLEAPVVFLIKADQADGRDASFGVVVDWPPESDRPVHFSLHGGSEWRGPGRDALFEREKAQAERERLNLLYVAMTRARQALFVSGVDDGKEGTWLSQAAAALDRAEMGGLPEMAWASNASLAESRNRDEPEAAPQTRGSSALPASLFESEAISPVGARLEPAGPEAEFGIHVHAWIEGITEGLDETDVRTRLALDDTTAARARSMAWRILEIPELAAAFDPARYLSALNEMEFLDPSGRTARIDRLVEFASEVWVLDYKTGGLNEPDLARRAEPYLGQMAGYRVAAQALYPGKTVRVALVFGDGQLLWVEASDGIGHDSPRSTESTP